MRKKKRGKLSGPSEMAGKRILSSVADTALEFGISKGVPWLAKKGVEAGRYNASEAMRDPKLQRKAINYAIKKRTTVDRRSWQSGDRTIGRLC